MSSRECDDDLVFFVALHTKKKKKGKEKTDEIENEKRRKKKKNAMTTKKSRNTKKRHFLKSKPLISKSNKGTVVRQRSTFIRIKKDHEDARKPPPKQDEAVGAQHARVQRERGDERVPASNRRDENRNERERI